MDFIWILLLMALLYGLPELLRKKQRKTYEYPQVPEQAPVPPAAPPQQPTSGYEITVSRPHGQLLSDLSEQEPFAPMAVAAPSTGLDEQPFFSTRQVTAGIVWAEILAKPKTVRPYLPKRIR